MAGLAPLVARSIPHGGSHCDRCDQPTMSIMMSMFNTDNLCAACVDDEQAAPAYPAAIAAENAAIRGGDYNFAGVGLDAATADFLRQRRAERAS